MRVDRRIGIVTAITALFLWGATRGGPGTELSADEEPAPPAGSPTDDAAPEAKGVLPWPISDRRTRARWTERGGTPEAAAAIEKALGWLATSQRENGSWSSAPLDKHDTGVTGLALTAFAARGIGPGEDGHGPVVQRAIAYLLGRQDPTGLFCTGDRAGELEALRAAKRKPGETWARTLRRWGARDVYDHAIATSSLAEVRLLTGDEALDEPLRRACRWAGEQQSPYLSWGYEKHARGLHDRTPITLWMTSAQWTVRSFLPDDSGWTLGKKGAHAWLARQRASGQIRIPYQDRAEVGGAQPNAAAADRATDGRRPHALREGTRPEHFGEGNTAMFVVFDQRSLALLEAKTRRKWKDAKRDERLDLIAARKPDWGDGTTVDLHSWLWSALALRQAGGERWTTWNRALTEALVANQAKDGSWEPVGIWGTAGKAYTTAMASLCLSTPSRFDDVAKPDEASGEASSPPPKRRR